MVIGLEDIRPVMFLGVNSLDRFNLCPHLKIRYKEE